MDVGDSHRGPRRDIRGGLDMVKRCSRCQSRNVYEDEVGDDFDLVCLQCGYRVLAIRRRVNDHYRSIIGPRAKEVAR